MDSKLPMLHFVDGDKLVSVMALNLQFSCASCLLFHHIRDYLQKVVFLPWNCHHQARYQSQLC